MVVFGLVPDPLVDDSRPVHELIALGCVPIEAVINQVFKAPRPAMIELWELGLAEGVDALALLGSEIVNRLRDGSSLGFVL